MWEEIVKHLNISEKWARCSFRIWLSLFIISFIILWIWVQKYNISLNGDNLMFIVAWLFFSWLVLIIVPMYFWIKNRELDIKEEIQFINSLEKFEILKEIKNYLYYKYDKEKLFSLWFVNFQLDKTDKNTKILFKKDDFKINLWLWNDDYWKIYLWTKNDKTLEKFKTIFIKDDEWKKNSYPYKDEINSLDDIKTQLDNIIEIIK